jgi:hypothetical protein
VGPHLILRTFEADSSRLVIIPLSFLRRLDSLKYTSVIALCSITYLVVLVVAHFIKGDTLPDRGEVRVFRWAGPVAVLAAFPVIVFAYTCHQNVSTPSSHVLLLFLTVKDVLHPQRDCGQLALPNHQRHSCKYRHCLCTVYPYRYHWVPVLRRQHQGEHC